MQAFPCISLGILFTRLHTRHTYQKLGLFLVTAKQIYAADIASGPKKAFAIHDMEIQEI